MRKLYAALALVATIIGSALAFGDGLTVPFSMPVTTCTNQFVRSIAAITGAGTCATVSLTADVSNTLPIANGGTNDTGTAWTTFVPTVTCGTGTVTSYTTQLGRYKSLGKTIWISLDVKVNNAGTCAGQITLNTLPVAGTTGVTFQVMGGRNGTTGVMLSCTIGSNLTTVIVKKTDNTDITATDEVVCTGVYETI